MSDNNKSHRRSKGEGSVRRREKPNSEGKKTVYYEGRVTIGVDPLTGKQIQKSVTAKTKAEALEKVRMLAVDVDKGTYQAPTNLTVGEWFEIWKNEYLSNIKPNTALLYADYIRLYLAPYLGHIKLAKLTTDSIQRMFNALKNQISPKTIKNVYGVLHRALQQAVDNNYIIKNPATACKRPKVSKPKINPFSRRDLAMFLSAIKGHCHEFLYLIAVYTGMREGELLGLTWDCVDLEAGNIVVLKQVQRERKKGGKCSFTSTKNCKDRDIPIDEDVIAIFRHQKFLQEEMRKRAGEKWTEQNLVFSNQTGGFLSNRTVYDCYKRILHKIGCPAYRFHDLRHTFATYHLEAGTDIKTVSELLGHADVGFTLNTYGHVTKIMRTESARRISKSIESVCCGVF